MCPIGGSNASPEALYSLMLSEVGVFGKSSKMKLEVSIMAVNK